MSETTDILPAAGTVSTATAATAVTALSLKVSAQILEHALAGRFDRDGHITELALSGRLGVSRTPIRAALQYLHTLGVLDHAPRRGFRLCATRAQLVKAQRSLPQDDANTLYCALLRDRTSGCLASRVTEHELEQRYGTRRTVVREVLLRLLQDGILRGRSGQRWEFAEAMDAESERESYRFRMLMECGGLAEPGFRVDLARLRACRERQRQLMAHATRRSWVEFFEGNAEVHELLAEGSGNRYLLKAVQEQNRLRRISDISDYPVVNVELLRVSCREHVAVLDAVERGDLAEASGLLRSHLERASDILERRVAGTLVSGV